MTNKKSMSIQSYYPLTMEAAYSSVPSAAAYTSNKEEASRGVRLQRATTSSACESSLHSVRKTPLKTMNKKPTAPMPPTRPRVYKVDPVNFRDLVQKLTGASDILCSSRTQQQQQSRLKSVAPPPINVCGGGDTKPDHHSASAARQLQLLPSPALTPFSALYRELMTTELSDSKPYNLSPSSTTVTSSASLGLSLSSPSTYNCFAYPLLSPATLSSLGQKAVL